MSELFKDKYKNRITQDYLQDLVERMAELKSDNYHKYILIDQNKDQINEIVAALKELGIEVEDE